MKKLRLKLGMGNRNVKKCQVCELGKQRKSWNNEIGSDQIKAA